MHLDQLKRREFITLLSGAAAASIPCTQPPSAQQTRPVIGILGLSTAEEYAFLIAAFRKSPTETGYFERQNVTIEYGGSTLRSPELAADLVHHPGGRIAAAGNKASRRKPDCVAHSAAQIDLHA
jgi:hypothetical protein